MLEPPSRWDPVAGTYPRYAHVGDFDSLAAAEQAAAEYRTADTECFVEPVRWNEVERTVADDRGPIVEAPAYERTGPAERFEG